MDQLRLIADQLQTIREQFGYITKRLDEIDEKLDNYQVETAQIKNDVSWIKGSGKIAVTLLITAIGGIVTALIKFIPNMG